HDSLFDERPAAVEVAEQMAPTDTTLTGDPPASLCAGTLLVAVLKFSRSCCGGGRPSGPPAAHCGLIAKMFRRRTCAASRTFCTTRRIVSAVPRLTKLMNSTGS